MRSCLRFSLEYRPFSLHPCVSMRSFSFGIVRDARSSGSTGGADFAVSVPLVDGLSIRDAGNSVGILGVVLMRCRCLVVEQGSFSRKEEAGTARHESSKRMAT